MSANLFAQFTFFDVLGLVFAGVVFGALASFAVMALKTPRVVELEDIEPQEGEEARLCRDRKATSAELMSLEEMERSANK